MALVLGADIGGSLVKFVLGRGGEPPIASGEIPTDPEQPRATLAHLAEVARSRCAAALGPLTAVGMACAGIVSRADGRLGRSPNLPGWQHIDLPSLAREVFGALPVTTANDVNAAAYGEWRLGAGRGYQDLVMIALGTGVGGGVIAGGALLLGAHGAAGEIGHTTLDPLGPRCRCGNHGCLEAYAGAVALQRRAAEIAVAGESTSAFRALVEAAGETLDLGAVHRLALAGDPTACAFFAEAGRHLGRAVANCVNILDPGLVIIGGGIAQAGELILAPCREVVRRQVLAEESRRVPIVVAQLGPQAAALGAAEMARESWKGRS